MFTRGYPHSYPHDIPRFSPGYPSAESPRGSFGSGPRFHWHCANLGASAARFKSSTRCFIANICMCTLGNILGKLIYILGYNIYIYTHVYVYIYMYIYICICIIYIYVCVYIYILGNICIYIGIYTGWHVTSFNPLIPSGNQTWLAGKFLYKCKLTAGKIIEVNGGFSSKPRLITGGYRCKWGIREDVPMISHEFWINRYPDISNSLGINGI